MFFFPAASMNMAVSCCSGRQPIISRKAGQIELLFIKYFLPAAVNTGDAWTWDRKDEVERTIKIISYTEKEKLRLTPRWERLWFFYLQLKSSERMELRSVELKPQGGYSKFTQRGVRRIFLGLKFRPSVFFWVKKSGGYFFGSLKK